MPNPDEKLTKRLVPALEEILGRRWKVLDDGFVRAVDYLGSDEAIVQAARVSYGVGTKSVHEDAALIRYLMRRGHTTPFEMCEIKLHVRAPMDTWRQWIRHRTANVNEYSTRYSVAIDSASRTAPTQWRRQSTTSRQGSGAYLPEDIGKGLSAKEAQLLAHAREVYEDRLGADVAREQARKDLPLSTYTEAYWKIDLHNLLHFLRLRMDAHAQSEIRAFASVIGNEIVSRWCPATWGAFRDYQLSAIQLSSFEIALVRDMAEGNHKSALERAERYGWLREVNGELKSNRERSEAEEKFEQLGFEVPWKRGRINEDT